MAINFPDSPTNGQVFTSGSTSWTWDGTKWNLNTNVAVSNDSLPVGAIMWFGNTTTTPPGFIAADGSAVSRTTYATLFSIIGTTYGTGDGSTTFNVPNVAATTGKYYIRYTTALGTQTTTSLSTAPVGTMMDWPVTSSYPTGWLRADGSAVSRTSYADLFALISTTYGSGNGSTTFNLPNMVSAGSGSPVGIIKASLGGIVEPSTVSHAASHVRGGSDIIDGDRVQVDYSPIYYTRDSSDVNAGANTDLTAHLKGIDTKVSNYIICTSSTRPSSPYNGQQIYETDTKKELIWNGSVWVVRANYTLSYTPTFWAYRTTGTSNAVQTIVFTNTYENVGNHYSTTTGLFTAPVDGVYTFHFQTLQNTGVTGNSMFKFIKNGSVISGPATYGDRSNWGTVTMGTTTFMNSGNTMGVYAGYAAGLYADGANIHNGFSGALINYR